MSLILYVLFNVYLMLQIQECKHIKNFWIKCVKQKKKSESKIWHDRTLQGNIAQFLKKIWSKSVNGNSNRFWLQTGSNGLQNGAWHIEIWKTPGPQNCVGTSAALPKYARCKFFGNVIKTAPTIPQKNSKNGRSEMSAKMVDTVKNYLATLKSPGPKNFTKPSPTHTEVQWCRRISGRI